MKFTSIAYPESYVGTSKFEKESGHVKGRDRTDPPQITTGLDWLLQNQYPYNNAFGSLLGALGAQFR